MSPARDVVVKRDHPRRIHVGVRQLQRCANGKRSDEWNATPEQYGHDLYANLRTLDKAGCQRILVQDVPEGERWEAIRDRLLRAASSVSESDDTGSMAVLP